MSNRIRNGIGQLGLNVNYAIKDTLDNRREFAIGVVTVMLVVAVVSLLQNSIVASGSIFVRLSETQVGENDLILLPDIATLTRAAEEGSVPQFWLNETEISDAIAKIDTIAGSTPRWTLLGRVMSPLTPQINTSTVILVIDSPGERSLGLGKTWTHRTLNDGECYVSSSLLRQLGIHGDRGEKIRLTFDLLGLAQNFGLGGGALPANLDISQQFSDFLAQSLNVNTTDDLDLADILNQLGVDVPENFTLGLPVADLFGGVSGQLDSFLAPSADLTVVDGVFADGKYPAALGNVLILEMSHISSLISQLFPPLPQQTRAFLDTLANVNPAFAPLLTMLNAIQDMQAPDFPLQHYAMQVIVQLNNRNQVYSKDAEGIQRVMIDATNELFQQLGFEYPAIPSTPLVGALEGVEFVELFLEQIFGAVMAVLVFLGAMLIYSLLLGNVNQKTYEYGMLRALGMKRVSLVSLLAIVAVIFTVPGISFGMLGAWLLNVPVNLLLQLIVRTAPEFSLSYSAVLIGLAVGILMPIISNVVPIRRALSKTLRDSLDVYHQSASETSVKIIRLQSMGFSTWQMVVSVVMVIAGFLVYYMIPYSFTFENWGLFLGIMNVILLGMVLGFCLIATTLQPLLQRAVLFCLLFGKDRRMQHMINKNLSAHHSRNQKTALMFTVSLAFIVFAGASFSLQSSSIRDTISLTFGSDVYVQSPSWSIPLPREDLRNIMEQQKLRGLVEAYTFASYPLDDHPRIDRTYIGNLASSPNQRIDIIALTADYMDSIYEEFFIPSEVDRKLTYAGVQGGSKPDLVRSLYEDEGNAVLPIELNGIKVPPSVLANAEDATTASMIDPRTKQEIYYNYTDVIMSEALRSGASVDVNTALRLQVRYLDVRNRRRTLSYLAKARAMVTKFPGFFTSSYQQTASGSPILVTTESYLNFMGTADRIQEITKQAESTYKNITEIPVKTLYARLKKDATPSETESVINALRNFITDDRIQVINTQALVDTTSTATDAMLIFFNIVAVINSVLSFFLLWLSFDANVRENSWEFGVLRAVGVSSAQVVRAYIYEALAVVIAAILLGTVVGLLVSITLTLQFGLFIELPFKFLFPTTLFLTVLVISLVVAVLGSYLPADQLRKLRVADVLRGK